jgi:hypothetical protein
MQMPTSGAASARPFSASFAVRRGVSPPVPQSSERRGVNPPVSHTNRRPYGAPLEKNKKTRDSDRI